MLADPTWWSFRIMTEFSLYMMSSRYVAYLNLHIFFDVIWTLQISTGKTMISRSIWINTLSNISKLFQNNTRGIYPKFPVETI